MRFSVVCELWNAAPISGNATLATARFRLATAATRISAERTRFELGGEVEASVPTDETALSLTFVPPSARLSTKQLKAKGGWSPAWKDQPLGRRPSRASRMDAMSRRAAWASPDWDESVADGTLGVVMTPECHRRRWRSSAPDGLRSRDLRLDSARTRVP